MARFLLRPAPGRCRNLASRALGLCLRRVGRDYERIYGLRPVLVETYVGPGHSGASCRATGWSRAGVTAGRDRNRRPVPPKEVWLRPLCKDWRRRLGARVEPLAPHDGLDSAGWAGQEFGGADLGDARLTRRLVASAALLGRSFSKTFYTAAHGNSAMTTGYYRLIEHPDTAAVSAQAILGPHRGRTRRRIQGQDTVLLIQDGTDVNLATHGRCEGLGMISRNKGAEGTLGLHLHSTFAVSADGIPPVVPRIEFDAPPDGGPKTLRWVRALDDSARLVDGLSDVRAVAVMDREGDAFEVFDAWRRLNGRIDILIRAGRDRSLGKGCRRLFARMRLQPVKDRMRLQAPRRSPRRAARGQPAFPGRAARDAVCGLRWKTLDLPVPEKQRPRLGAQSVRLAVVHVRETAPPADGSEPVEQFLLTSLPVTCSAEAREVTRFYQLRWRIEDWHRVLKTGCAVEKTAHRARERVERETALRAVIAWRLLTLALLGRETPDLEPSALFSETEIAVMADYADALRLPPPGDLGTAVAMLARMGGYLGRKYDDPAGAQTVWEGYAFLSHGAAAVERALAAGRGSRVAKLLAQG